VVVVLLVDTIVALLKERMVLVVLLVETTVALPNDRMVLVVLLAVITGESSAKAKLVEKVPDKRTNKTKIPCNFFMSDLL
jgi:hypothetical protein